MQFYKLSTEASIVNWGQDRVVDKCPYCHDKDMGLNPTATIKENMAIWGLPTKGGPVVQ